MPNAVPKLVSEMNTYCKGCGICTAECPKKAIDFVLEADCVKEGK